MMITPEKAIEMLEKLSDDDIKDLLQQGLLTIEPYDRNKAIKLIAGIPEGCGGCNQDRKKVKVTYINPQGSSECGDCK